MYKEMIQSARSSGTATEQHMHNAINRIDSFLEKLKDTHPDAYWRFMRSSHQDLFGPHYDESYANYDLSHLRYTGRDGAIHTTPHWSADEVERGTASKTFPEGTTKWDKYVAYNATYADLCRKCNDTEILEIAHLFFFQDEDAPDGKIWHYMHAMNK